MAETNSPRDSLKSSSDDSEPGPGLRQGELSSEGSSWRQKFMANAYGRNSASLRRKRTAKKRPTGTSAGRPSADSEKTG